MDDKVYLFINSFIFYFVCIYILPVCVPPVHLVCAETKQSIESPGTAVTDVHVGAENLIQVFSAGTASHL